MICEVKGIPIYFEQYGEGKPVLCIHGYGVDHRLMSGCLEPVFERMPSHRRIYLDLPGMGRTPSRDWIQNADDMLDILCAFVQRVIPDENFLLIGESFGGHLALGLVQRMPERIGGLALICPVVANEREDLPVRHILYQSDALFAPQPDADLEAFLGMAVIATPEIYANYLTNIQSGIAIADKRFLSERFDGAFSPAMEAAIQAAIYEKPACILTGRQDHAVGYRQAYELLGRFPRATFVVLDCAGHNLQIDNAPVFEQMIQDWIWRIELHGQQMAGSRNNS